MLSVCDLMVTSLTLSIHHNLETSICYSFKYKMGNPNSLYIYHNVWGNSSEYKGLACLFVCFVALRPKSTAMVIAGRSVHLTTLFPRQA